MFSNPEKNVDQMGLLPTMEVADFGAGIGSYAIPLAKAVTAGKVYAIDVQKDLLTKLKNAAAQVRVFNIEIIVGDLEKLSGTHLKPESVDVVLASNVLFQTHEKKNVAQEMKRILKKNGRAIVIDWRDSDNGIGPHPGDIFTEHKARELFQGEGLVFDRTISAGDHHYGIIFKKI